MGVKLKDLVVTQPIDMEFLRGRSIGIDAFNYIFQFLSVIRDKFTGEPLRDSKGRVTSHLSGLFYRTTRMIESGIEPVYVFDGIPPSWKKKTIEDRKKIREVAEQKWKEAVEKGEDAIKYAQGASKLTDEMIENSKRILEAMGVSWIQAPSEGEAQVAYMVKKGQLWAGASSDYDSLLFGMPRLVRNLNIVGKKKLPGKQAYIEVKPELIELEKVLDNLQITQEQLILLGILIGTDFAAGVKGTGPKTALKIVKENKTIERVKSAVKWESDVQIEDLLEFFKNPPTEEIEIKKYSLDIEKLKKLMVDEHGFGEERIGSSLEKLVEIKKSGSRGLNMFLK